MNKIDGWKLLVLERNTWNLINVCKLVESYEVFLFAKMIDKKLQLKKKYWNIEKIGMSIMNQILASNKP